MARGAEDHGHPLGDLEPAEDHPHLVAPVAELDPPRDARARGVREEDDVAAGQRDARGEARALVPERAARDLDEDQVPGPQQVLDPPALGRGRRRHAGHRRRRHAGHRRRRHAGHRRRLGSGGGGAPGLGDGRARGEGVRRRGLRREPSRVYRRRDVGRVEEAREARGELDERCPDPALDVLDAADVDVPLGRRVGAGLDVDLLEAAVLDQGHADLFGLRGIDKEDLFHGGSSERITRPSRRPTSRGALGP